MKIQEKYGLHFGMKMAVDNNEAELIQAEIVERRKQ